MKRSLCAGWLGGGILLAALTVLVVTVVLFAQPATYRGVAFPLGDRAFADRVVEYVVASCVRGAFDDPEEALGPPDACADGVGCCGCALCGGLDSNAVAQRSGQSDLKACDGCDTNAVSLGFRLSELDSRGYLILEFVDNLLADVAGPDLFVYITNDHPCRVEISADGTHFIWVGQVLGYPAAIDIAPYVGPEERFRFVRLTDVPADEDHSACPGPSIDAVGAMGPAEQVIVGEAFGSLELQPAGELSLSLNRAPDSLLIMLDTSSSMADFVDGQAKIDIAKSVIIDLLNTLPDSMYVGMRSFGGCGHSREISPIVSEPNHEWFQQQVRSIQPAGATPIAYALDLAGDDFADAPGTKLILLVSDGMETCGGDPVAAAKQLIAAGYDLRIDVVGFRLGEDNAARDQLIAIAEATGGAYFDAENSDELRRALSLAAPFAYTVYDESGNIVYAGRLGDNGPKLPAGTYRVVIETTPQIVLEQVIVVDQQTTKITVERANGVYDAQVGGG